MAAPRAQGRATYGGPVVYHDEDEYGAIDVVDEGEGKLLSLQFGTLARQSTMLVAAPDALALEYTRCLMTGLLFLDRDPQRALLLGLGGGSLAKFLLRQVPGCRVDVVELRPRVVAVARRFFALPSDGERLRVHVADGRRFVLEEAGLATFDLILVDLHTSQGVAPAVLEPDFAPGCRRAATGRGVVAANLWYGVDEAQERLVRGRLEEAFDTVLYLPVAGKRNCVALALPEGPLPPPAELRQRARVWQARCGLPLPSLLEDLARHNP